MLHAILIDSHEMARYGMRCALADLDDIEIVGEAVNSDSALSLIRSLKPNIIMLDINLPGVSGIELTRKALHINPEIKVIIINAGNDPVLANYALQAGAAGYLTKSEGPQDFISAIKKVCAGQKYIASEIAQNIALQKTNGGIDNPIHNLSVREMEVVLMVSQGDSVPAIAKKLFLSPKTVNTYRYRVFDKLSIKNNVELTHLMLKQGILEQETNFQDVKAA